MENTKKETGRESMNRLTVHMNDVPVYDIVMAEDFSFLPEEIKNWE